MNLIRKMQKAAMAQKETGVGRKLGLVNDDCICCKAKVRRDARNANHRQD